MATDLLRDKQGNLVTDFFREGPVWGVYLNGRRVGECRIFSDAKKLLESEQAKQPEAPKPPEPPAAPVVAAVKPETPKSAGLPREVTLNAIREVDHDSDYAKYFAGELLSVVSDGVLRPPKTQTTGRDAVNALLRLGYVSTREDGAQKWRVDHVLPASNGRPQDRTEVVSLTLRREARR